MKRHCADFKRLGRETLFILRAMKTLCVLLLAIASLAMPAAAAVLPDRVTFSAAIERGDLPLARQWLDAGLPPDFEGSVIGTGLMIGAWDGSIPIMELFLAHGANVDQTNALGETALLHAAWKGHLDAVRWLLAHGAQVNRPDKQWAALHYAAFAGHEAVVRTLLEQGADIDALSPNGSTPLMMTAREGRAGVAAQLLAAGAHRDIVNDNGENAVRWAMRNNNLKIAREIAGTDDFAALAARPAVSWGRPVRSQPVPDRTDSLLAQAHKMEAAGQREAALKLYRAALAALRASEVSAGKTAQLARPVTGLAISARRDNPAQQTTGLHYATPAVGAGVGNVGAALPVGRVGDTVAAGQGGENAVDALLHRARELEATGNRAAALAAYRQAAAVLRGKPLSGP